ncbi:hypothetical protein N7481_006555 [Penicillium waksmanii]|uniref:uncharacterized protein n=1 Tax=Penicillium waksmanii TaxID=69791 RepID=UPI0025468635|nr:uncharacterized protein N7481_006555 [Penicillium waksmanii]KAJ5984456.1 hypothetical protein N7481_006555 [Penicillium waksmanii]
MMNPYEADPKKIPTTDMYADVPLYGRYGPKPNDFRVEFQYINSQTTDSVGCDVFALGSVIVKSSHLHARDGAISKTALGCIRVLEIYFAGKLSTPAFYCQPCDSLLHILMAAKCSSKKDFQASGYVLHSHISQRTRGSQRDIYQLHTLKPTENLQTRCHVVPDPNYIYCIVDSGKVVGLFDWEMVGYFGWKTAGDVHCRIRTPQREHIVNANLREDELQYIMFWNDLYDVGKSEN